MSKIVIVYSLILSLWKSPIISDTEPDTEEEEEQQQPSAVSSPAPVTFIFHSKFIYV